MNALRIAILAALIASPSLAVAGTVAGFGGATEITQLANNVQLAQAYTQQLQTALNSARQYQLMVEQLRRNPAGFAGRLTQPEIERHLRNADAATQMVTRLERLHRDQSFIYSSMDRAHGTIVLMNEQGHAITPEEYSRLAVRLAKEDRGIWRDQVTRLKEASARSEEDMRAVRAISDSADGMTTQIEGLSNIVKSQAIMSRQMAELSGLLREQMALEASERANEANERILAAQMHERAVADHRAMMENLEAWRASLPAPGEPSPLPRIE